MTIRQIAMRFIYPVILKAGKWFGLKAAIHKNSGNMIAPVSFYALTSISNSGSTIEFSQYKGKKVLLVNTASDCGYTPQLTSLQKLQDQYKDELIVIGFPSNDFKNQEKGSDKEIAAFCSINFNVHFTLIKKSVVLKNAEQNKVFEWLTTQQMNGWNNNEPAWNFTKYLVNENGMLTYVFDTGIAPLDERVLQAMEE